MSGRILLPGAILLLLFFVAAPKSATAGSLVTNRAEDVSALFCADMMNEDLYDKYQLDSYKLLIPGKNGWVFRSESDFRNDFSLDKATLNNLHNLSEAFRLRGTELVIVLPPTRGLLNYQNLSDEERARYGFTPKEIEKIWASYWDAIDSLHKHGIKAVGIPRPDPMQPYFYKRDHHWNPEGARYTAKVVADYIKHLRVYKEINKVEFVTHELDPYEYYGVSKKVFRKLCRTNQPAETIIRTVTERKELTDGKSDLFGATEDPDIILLGTSNSTMEPSFANFEGFLKESLSADVLNMSVSGGGLDTAVISYLNSQFYEKKAPKIAIWEIPGYYNINKQHRFFREAIPAVYGNCESPLAFQKDLKLDASNVIALEGLGRKRITGKDYYVMFDFPTRITEAFTVDLRYLKNLDRYKFQRTERYPHDGRFYVELRDSKKSYLDKVIIKVPPHLKDKTVNVKVCQKDTGGGLLAFAGKFWN
jgi:alginate biosynthesis protein AlgX